MAKYSEIPIDQGASFNAVILVTTIDGLPFDLTDFSVRGQIRRSMTSSTSIVWTCTIEDALEGKIRISLTPAQTDALRPGRYVYDVEIYNILGDVIRVSEGQVAVNQQVTKA